MLTSTPAVFDGLNAFPLTPLEHDTLDEAAFAGLVARLAASDVDAITALGSTGSYAYLSIEERARVARIAVEHAGAKPVVIGIGALRTSHVLANVEHAEAAGAAGLLLAPVSYQPLTEHDVLELFRAVAQRTELPIAIYDNPGTTHFRFTVELYARIAELPGVATVKIPAVPTDPAEASAHVRRIRAALPPHVRIGVSGDASAAAGLNAGCDAWFSVLAGTLPELALPIARAARAGRGGEALTASARLDPLWGLFAEFGSLRVTAAIAEHLGLAPRDCLPEPVQGLDAAARTRVAEALASIRASAQETARGWED